MLRVYNKNISQEELILTDHAKSLTFLESKAKWALGCITTNKVSRDDGIPAELFQIIKDDAVEVLHTVCQQMWKTQQWPQDWKRSVFISVPKKGNAREFSNYRTLHSSDMLVK